jgi:hypothetical protein
MPVIMVTARMPLPGEKPEFVDAVIAKSHCVDLLVPTLEVLGASGPPEGAVFSPPLAVEEVRPALASSGLGERKAA